MVAAAIGDVLRHALGLSAWKQFRDLSWSLRVNPSSGNLHPTAAYIVSGATSGLANRPGVYHYAPDRHELELRCVFEERAWESVCLEHSHTVLVALTSIHWREAWKYGERAFRYCQHDLGSRPSRARDQFGHRWLADIRSACMVASRDPDAYRTGSRRRLPRSRARRPRLPDRADADLCAERHLERRRAARGRCRQRPMVGFGEPVERTSRPVDVHRRDCS